MKKILSFLSILALLQFAACTDGGGHASLSRMDSFINMIHNHYGYIGSSNFTIVKYPSQTATEGFVVVYDGILGEYVAFDINDYYIGQTWSAYINSAEYAPVLIDGSYVDVYGERMYFGDAYDFYGFYQGEFVFDESAENSKDLEKVAALMESFKVEKMGEAMAMEFGLSEKRGIEIAKISSQMQKMAKKRGLTEADANTFSKEILGVDFKTAESALRQKLIGDSSEFEALLNEASAKNEISPEHMNKIISELFQKG